jgi:hypothetical protein
VSLTSPPPTIRFVANVEVASQLVSVSVVLGDATPRALVGTWGTSRLSNHDVLALLKAYRPELIGRDDITTADERRRIASLIRAYERGASKQRAASGVTDCIVCGQPYPQVLGVLRCPACVERAAA